MRIDIKHTNYWRYLRAKDFTTWEECSAVAIAAWKRGHMQSALLIANIGFCHSYEIDRDTVWAYSYATPTTSRVGGNPAAIALARHIIGSKE